jgi:hypothetical protein
MDSGKSVSKRGDAFVLLVAQGGPGRGIVPKGAGAGGVVQAVDMGPELNTVVGSKEASPRATEELVVDGSAAMDGTLIQEGGQILGEGSVVGAGGGLLEDVDAIRAPRIAPDFRCEDAFPAGKLFSGRGKLQSGGPADLVNQFVSVAGPILVIVAGASRRERGGGHRDEGRGVGVGDNGDNRGDNGGKEFQRRRSSVGIGDG